MIVGYARVSTSDQEPARQVDELTAAGADRVFTETASGKRGAHRPEWAQCLDVLRAGDTLVCTELSRLGRNTSDLAQLLDDLDEFGVALRILNLGIDTSTAGGRLVYAIVAAVAAMERDLLIERTTSGIAAARARGRFGGRRQQITPAEIRRAQKHFDKGDLTIDEIARAAGYSRSTLYRHLRIGSVHTDDP